MVSEFGSSIFSCKLPIGIAQEHAGITTGMLKLMSWKKWRDWYWMVRIITEPSILLSFYIYCYYINLVPFLFISVMLSTFPFPLKPHSELLVDCYYPVLYQLMEPRWKEEDVNQSYIWDSGLVDWFSYSLKPS